MIYLDELRRIASALEKIADSLSHKPQIPAKPRKAHVSGVGQCIAQYVNSWQSRYQTKSRPEIRQAQGVFKAILQERTQDELIELIQVYCQMDDPWFIKKRHDIATFGANVGKIALARDKGMETTETNWERVFGGGGNGKRDVHRGNAALTNTMAGSLYRGQDADAMEDLSECE